MAGILDSWTAEIDDEPMLEIVLMIVGVVLALAEFFIWDFGLLWHDEPKRDPRNSRPPY